MNKKYQFILDAVEEATSDANVGNIGYMSPFFLKPKGKKLPIIKRYLDQGWETEEDFPYSKDKAYRKRVHIMGDVEREKDYNLKPGGSYKAIKEIIEDAMFDIFPKGNTKPSKKYKIQENVGDVVILQKGAGYWKTDRYSIGGDFRRAKEDTTITLTRKFNPYKGVDAEGISQNGERVAFNIKHVRPR